MNPTALKSPSFHVPSVTVCLSPVIDCFDGKVISWTVGMRRDAQLVNTMLNAAIERIDLSSCRRVRWPSQRLLAPQCGLRGRSIEDRGFHHGNWQSTTVDQFTQAFNSYIRGYNEMQIKMSLGARSPIDCRRSLGPMA